MKLTDAQREFLSLLARYDVPLSRKHLPLADRTADRVRQSCRRLGYAEFVGGWINHTTRITNGWTITDAGRRALQEQTDE